MYGERSGSDAANRPGDRSAQPFAARDVINDVPAPRAAAGPRGKRKWRGRNIKRVRRARRAPSGGLAAAVPVAGSGKRALKRVVCRACVSTFIFVNVIPASSVGVSSPVRVATGATMLLTRVPLSSLCNA